MFFILNLHYQAKLGLKDKGHAIKGLVVCNSLDVSAWGSTIKELTLLSTVPMMIRKITFSVDYNYWLKRLNTNQNLF